LALGLVNNSREVGEGFVDAKGVELAMGIKSLSYELLQMSARDLCGEGVGDDFAGAEFLLDPGFIGEGDPHGATVNVETDVGGIDVAGGDGDYGGFPCAVKLFVGEGVGDGEFFVHGF